MLRRDNKKLRKLDSRGDTIVEIMIVLAILGLAIGISYATADRSLLNVRQAEENTTATTLVQSQIENLRTLTKDRPGDPNDPFAQSGGFCVDGNDNIQPLSSPNATDFSLYYPTGTACINSNLFYIDDSYDSSTHTFTVEAAWSDVLGEGNDTVTMFYRLYPPS
jgi:prepilin-type N-terminal cleavage/methylation domain-containing protein